MPVRETHVRDSLNSLLTGDRWIIDGWGPWDCVVRRLQQSDTIVYIDFPVWIHLWWAAKRQRGESHHGYAANLGTARGRGY